MPTSSFSLLGLWPIVNRWKYLVASAVVAAAIVSTAVALLLPNIYASTAIFIPTNPQSTDPDRLVDGGKLELGGRSEDLDRVITIGESQPVAEYIIRRFDLHKRYQVGAPGDDNADNSVLTEFNSNLSIVHNDRDAIELTFADEDKQLAAQVANTMVQVIDSINQQLTLENRRQVLNLYRQRFDYLNTNFERSRRQLAAARRRYGIFAVEMQGRYLAKELIETEAALRKAEGGGGDVAGLRKSLRGLSRADGGNLVNVENFTRGVDSLNMFAARVTDLQTRLIEARSAFESAELTLKARLSSLYLVQKAYPATRKAKPVRWLIVLSSTLLVFVLSIVFVALLELYRYDTHRGSSPA
jgi:uncharacterized protein involved in exopolysaccharide biosynthesis